MNQLGAHEAHEALAAHAAHEALAVQELMQLLPGMFTLLASSAWAQ